MFHHVIADPPSGDDCIAANAKLLFDDVDPEVLAREAASDSHRFAAHDGGAWQSYLRRVLPALERHSAQDMVDALLAAGHSPRTARTHALTMRRRSVADGDARRIRFWGEVWQHLADGSGP